MKSCPTCNSAERTKIRKGLFVRRIPIAKFYKCRECETKYYWIKGVNVSVKA